MTSDLRLFLAIDLPDALRLRLEKRLAPRPRDPGVRWTHPDQWHITVSFLGETRPDHLDALCESVTLVCATFAPIALVLSGGGTFGQRSPRVLWAGVTGNTNRLIDLAGALEKAFLKFGFPKDKHPFHPHVTLARVRRSAARHSVPRVRSLGEIGAFLVQHIVLYRSVRSPSGPTYTALKRFELTGS